MKDHYLFKYFAGFFLVVFLLSACDKFEEDTSPLLSATLVLKNDTYATKMNQAIQLQVLANDSISGETTVQFGKPIHGTLQATGTPGHAFYQPDQNFIGQDTLSYQVCLGGNCIAAKITIYVLPDSINNPCTVSIANDTATAIQGSITTINILQNDQACNLKPMISQQPQFGQATINTQNQLVYTPNANYTGTDVLQYQLTPTGGMPVTGQISIRVKASLPPCNLIANPETVNLVHNLPVDSIAIDVLANDTWCPTGPTATINLVSQSSFGSVIVSGTGTNARIIYLTNTPLHNITDSFQYRVCQGANCSTTTVSVNIQ